MARPATRISALQATLAIGAMLVVGRAGWLQLVRGREMSRQAQQTRLETHELEARRGTIYDRNGTPLVVSLTKFRVQLALNEVKDAAQLIRLATQQLGLPRDSLGRIFARGRPLYPYFYGPYLASQVEPLRRLAGVHLEPTYSRAYPNGALAAPVIGGLAPDGSRGISGLERSLDSVLAGEPGLTTDLRDPSGRLYESPARLVREPVPGNDIVLTIDAGLQDIAEFTLAKALKEYKARGGDVIFLDPRNGELLALASLTASGDPTASVFTGAFEPGSTAKPFTAAALLALGRVDSTEAVFGEDGKWTFETSPGHRRTITDAHPDKGYFTLARAIQKSSNIAMAKFSRKLRAEEQYEFLRAFGFGAPTGVEFPSEANGVLRRPHLWLTGYDAPSLATGYGLQVTPLQLAAAYGALANDGILVAPTLVREVRGADGAVVYRHATEPVRRVVEARVAARIREFLAEAASDSGTGAEAQVRGGILGKTGTARISEKGRYLADKYRASFAAIYPARDPQLVAVVTIDQPHGEYYGGRIAAPVTADMLRQALAARRSAIDRASLAEGRVVAGNGGIEAPEDEERVPASAVSLPLGRAPAPRPEAVVIPDLAGRTPRSAAFLLHQRGLRVRLEGMGRIVRSAPAAGDSLERGRTVVLFAAPGAQPR